MNFFAHDCTETVFQGTVLVLVPQIQPHSTSRQYPLINYLDAVDTNNGHKAKTTTNPSSNGNERGILLEAKKGQNGNGAASHESIPTIVNEREISCNNGVAGGQEAAKNNILGKLKNSAGAYLAIFKIGQFSPSNFLTFYYCQADVTTRNIKILNRPL